MEQRWRFNEASSIKACEPNRVMTSPSSASSWSLLDSYLVIAEHNNLKACVVLNKTDLPCEEIKATLNSLYSPLGYSMLLTNKQNDSQALEEQLNHETSVFVGQSGVGKSSIISSVVRDNATIQTGAISERTQLGQHTTSNSTFYHLPCGGALIDSPGVREFGLWHMPAADIAKGFKEFRPFLGQCKFRDCDHLISPGCALKEAVSNGKIKKERLENYFKISTQFAR